MLTFLCLFVLIATFSRMFSFLQFFLFFSYSSSVSLKKFPIAFYSLVPLLQVSLFNDCLPFISLSWVITFLRFPHLDLWCFRWNFLNFSGSVLKHQGTAFMCFIDISLPTCSHGLQEHSSVPYSFLLTKTLWEFDCDPCLLLIFV